MPKSGFVAPQILIFVLALAVLAGGYFAFKSGSNNLAEQNSGEWKTYTNAKYGYEIKIPLDWIYREFPDTQSGAGFQPADEPENIANEFISINMAGRGLQNCNAPFSEFVKIAATQSIEGFKKLNSIKEVTVDSGEKGYQTTWVYASRDGTDKTSLPMTYFDDGAGTCGDIVVSLNNPDYEATYRKTLSTFKFVSPVGFAPGKITILSPNGGENIELGNMVRIEWSYANLDKDSQVVIDLVRPASTMAGGWSVNLVAEIAKEKISKGEYIWTVPSNILEASDYKVRVRLQGDEVGDMSDNFFNIVGVRK